MNKEKRHTSVSIREMKGKTPIVCLTAYTTPIARLLDPHCDLLLVGDSVGMVLYGMVWRRLPQLDRLSVSSSSDRGRCSAHSEYLAKRSRRSGRRGSP